MIAAAFRTAKDGAGQAARRRRRRWIVFRVTDVKVPPVDLASDEIKKLKETLQREPDATNRSANTSPSSNPRSAPRSIEAAVAQVHRRHQAASN